MDENVRQSIDGRKQAIFAAYQPTEEMCKKIDELFDEITELGKGCNDVGEFESKFAASPLNQRYMDIFTEVAMSGQAKVAAPKVSLGGVGKMMAGGMAAGIAENMVDRAASQTVPTRAAVHQKAYDEVRKVPGLGDAIDIGQKASYAAHLGRMFRRKKDK